MSAWWLVPAFASGVVVGVVGLVVIWRAAARRELYGLLGL